MGKHLASCLTKQPAEFIMDDERFSLHLQVTTRYPSDYWLHLLVDERATFKTLDTFLRKLWLLGGTIISRVSLYDDYQADPLATLIDAVEMDGILPDHHHHMNQAELRAFSRMCRRFEKHLRQSV